MTPPREYWSAAPIDGRAIPVDGRTAVCPTPRQPGALVREPGGASAAFTSRAVSRRRQVTFHQPKSPPSVDSHK